MTYLSLSLLLVVGSIVKRAVESNGYVAERWAHACTTTITFDTV